MSVTEPAADEDIVHLRAELQELLDDRQRMRCMASIQSDAVQLALDLLVAHPDLRGFFRGFLKRLVDESGAIAGSVWLPDDAAGTIDLWMANVGDESITAESPAWAELQLPREALNQHLTATADAHVTTVEYDGDDDRLPAAVRTFNRERGIALLFIAPLRLADKTMGWLALASANESECDRSWRRALLDATARQATLALYYSRLVERSLLEARRQAVLEERNRIARDIHDTLAQGFGAILMQLQAAQRAGDGRVPAPVARSLDTAIELARRHLVDARRSVSALRPQSDERADVGEALAQMVDLARRTSDVPVELTVETLPTFDAGVDREIIGIAQEAITNATRHARARRIVVNAGAVRGVGFRLSVADDGRGMSGDCQSAGFGLTSMRERAERIGASLTFVTAPRAGTEVVLAWQPASFAIPRAVDAQH